MNTMNPDTKAHLESRITVLLAGAQRQCGEAQSLEDQARSLRVAAESSRTVASEIQAMIDAAPADVLIVAVDANLKTEDNGIVQRSTAADARALAHARMQMPAEPETLGLSPADAVTHDKIKKAMGVPPEMLKGNT
jgi:hypothetical protein